MIDENCSKGGSHYWGVFMYSRKEPVIVGPNFIESVVKCEKCGIKTKEMNNGYKKMVVN